MRTALARALSVFVLLDFIDWLQLLVNSRSIYCMVWYILGRSHCQVQPLLSDPALIYLEQVGIIDPARVALANGNIYCRITSGFS